MPQSGVQNIAIGDCSHHQCFAHHIWTDVELQAWA
jgi:hypothetical protein